MPAYLVSGGGSLSQVTSWVSWGGGRSSMLTGVSVTAA